MKTRNTLIGLGVAAALAAGVGAYSYTASAQGGPGYGPGMMGGGYGPGMMNGNGPGYGPSGGTGCDQGNGPMRGARPGHEPMHGRAGNDGQGLGMMQGHGPGMMQGNGPGYGPRGNVQANQALNLSTDDVKSRMERWLAWRDNPRLKLGEVKEKDADTITAEIVTKDNSLVERFIVDRHSGQYRRDNG